MSGATPTPNTVESNFALQKRGVYGTFHSISEAHLHRYLAEFDFRANTRKLTDAERGAALLAAPRASGCSINSLTKPRTAKQMARAFLRWRKGRPMKSILFHAIEPPLVNRSWTLFRQESQVLLLREGGAERLSSGVWLVALPDTRVVVGRLEDVARKHEMSYRLLQVEREGEWPPQWLLDQ